MMESGSGDYGIIVTWNSGITEKIFYTDPATRSLYKDSYKKNPDVKSVSNTNR